MSLFATEVAKVREVLDFTTITEIPRTPDFMSGVINLRGSVCRWLTCGFAWKCRKPKDAEHLHRGWWSVDG